MNSDALEESALPPKEIYEKSDYDTIPDITFIHDD
jgi:hypothetical protein